MIDASALLDAVIFPAYKEKLLELCQGDNLLVPEHFDIECVNGLRRLSFVTTVTTAQSDELFATLRDLPCVRLAVQPFLSDIWTKRHNFTAYDAAYVSIAQATGALLISDDNRMVKAAQQFVRTASLK